MKKIRIFLRIRSKNFVLDIGLRNDLSRNSINDLEKSGLMRNEIINSSETEFHDDASSIDRC